MAQYAFKVNRIKRAFPAFIWRERRRHAIIMIPLHYGWSCTKTTADLGHGKMVMAEYDSQIHSVFQFPIQDKIARYPRLCLGQSTSETTVQYSGLTPNSWF